MPEIVIIDYGMGNLRSVVKKIETTGKEVLVSDSHEEILKASKLILPGVGHFENGMLKLKEKGLVEILNMKVLKAKTPILGICLGMQLLTKTSEEGNVDGLGWIDAETVRFRLDGVRQKVPHMGWNTVICRKESVLIKNIPDNSSYYFVHSYYVRCNNEEDILGVTDYGHPFVSMVQRGNIFGTQFHPEKSHEWGERMIKNFLDL